MRDGRTAGTRSIRETDKNAVIEMMVGKVVRDYFAKAAAPPPSGHRSGSEELPVADAVEDLSFTLYRGEILALAGILVWRAPAPAFPLWRGSQESR
jgi:ABC-type sugar transport system ATPase subunit